MTSKERRLIEELIQSGILERPGIGEPEPPSVFDYYCPAAGKKFGELTKGELEAIAAECSALAAEVELGVPQMTARWKEEEERPKIFAVNFHTKDGHGFIGQYKAKTIEEAKRYVLSRYPQAVFADRSNMLFAWEQESDMYVHQDLNTVAFIFEATENTQFLPGSP